MGHWKWLGLARHTDDEESSTTNKCARAQQGNWSFLWQRFLHSSFINSWTRRPSGQNHLLQQFKQSEAEEPDWIKSKVRDWRTYFSKPQTYCSSQVAEKLTGRLRAAANNTDRAVLTWDSKINWLNWQVYNRGSSSKSTYCARYAARVDERKRGER